MAGRYKDSLFLRDLNRVAFIGGGIAAVAGGPLTLAAYLPAYISLRRFIKLDSSNAMWFAVGTFMAAGAAASFIGDNMDKAEKKATIAAETSLSANNKQTNDCENYSRRKYLGWGKVTGEVCVTLNYTGQNGDDIIASWSTSHKMWFGEISGDHTLIVFDPKRPEKFKKINYNFTID